MTAPGAVPPAPEYPIVPLDGTTEMRIHGVSGTPVQAMLHHPHPVQVSGTPLAGCYRRGDDHEPYGDTLPAGRNLEAYSWGGLTAGGAARAFWLLLLPFMLTNVASWAHPVRPVARFAPIGWMSAAIRAFALSLTVTFMLGTATVSMDLIAWQCTRKAAFASCGDKHFFTRFMADDPWSQPGIRLVLAALVPLAVLLALSLLSRSTCADYENYADDGDGGPLPAGAHDFVHPQFWDGGAPFQRLRSLHNATALAAVAGLLAFAAGRGDTGGARWLGSALPVLAVVLAGVCAVVVASPYAGRRRTLLENNPPPAWLAEAMAKAQYAGLALLLVAAWYAVFPAAPAERAPTMPGLYGTIWAVLGLQVVLLGTYLAFTLRARKRSPETARQTLLGRQLFRGCAPPVLATFALGVAGAFASGLVLRVADDLGKPVSTICLRPAAKIPTDPMTVRECASSELRVFVHPAYFNAARAGTLLVLATIGVGVWAGIWMRRRRRPCAATVEREYADVPAAARDPERTAKIARLQASAALTDRADMFVSVLLLVVVTGTLVLNYVHRDWVLPVLWWEWPIGAWRQVATTAGTWLIGLLAAGLVLVGRQAYKSETSRRTVGILWDLGTFWPRAAHPFAPPCYCERVVPEFTRRLGRMTAHGRVVVSAHSQGSVIAVAAVHRLGPERASRVALVTYGCPVERLYARVFPHFFGLDSLRQADDLLDGRWRNLYRRTDPIGGPVFTLDREGFTCAPADPQPDGEVDIRLRDPLYERQEGEFLYPIARGHSDYFHDSRFAVTVTAVADTIP